jgi:hypothetical protein
MMTSIGRDLLALSTVISRCSSVGLLSWNTSWSYGVVAANWNRPIENLFWGSNKRRGWNSTCIILSLLHSHQILSVVVEACLNEVRTGCCTVWCRSSWAMKCGTCSRFCLGMLWRNLSTWIIIWIVCWISVLRATILVVLPVSNHNDWVIQTVVFLISSCWFWSAVIRLALALLGRDSFMKWDHSRRCRLRGVHRIQVVHNIYRSGSRLNLQVLTQIQTCGSWSMILLR